MLENIEKAPTAFQIWLMAIRPKTLILSVGPILLAALLASMVTAPVQWHLFPVILLSAMSIQAATNLWNDAADASSGLDTKHERLGPPRVTSLGLLSGKTVRIAAIGLLIFAAVCGLYLVFSGGLPILMIGLVGIICAFSYSSGPYPISGSPFGEAFVVLFFGIMSVMGSSYLLTGQWNTESLWAGFYIGLPAAAVLTVNNHRDRVGDKAGGRRTLAIKLGPRRTKQLYAIMLLISCLGLFHLYALMNYGTLSLVSLVVSAIMMVYALLVPIRQFFNADGGPALNQCLLSTSLFQLVWLVAFFAILMLA